MRPPPLTASQGAGEASTSNWDQDNQEAAAGGRLQRLVSPARSTCRKPILALQEDGRLNHECAVERSAGAEAVLSSQVRSVVGQFENRAD